MGYVPESLLYLLLFLLFLFLNVKAQDTVITEQRLIGLKRGIAIPFFGRGIVSGKTWQQSQTTHWMQHQLLAHWVIGLDYTE